MKNNKRIKNKEKTKKSFHKLYFYFLITLLVFAIGLVANAAIDITKPWHPLQQIAKNKSIMLSVDENRDNVIDEAETLTLVNGVATIGDISGATALAIKGISNLWSAIDFYSDDTNMWGIGRNSDGNFYIDRTGIGNALKIDKNNRDVEINRGIKIGNTATANAGTIRWTGSDLEVHDGTGWVSLTGGASSITCTSFTYNAWGSCLADSTQTRTVATSTPEGCTGGDPVLIQSCTYVPPLSDQCNSAGGDWHGGQGVCYFSGSSCVSGWTKKASYSTTTIDTTCTGCTPSSTHVRNNIATESCGYSVKGSCKRTQHVMGGYKCFEWNMISKTCYAIVQEIGCTKT